MVELASFTKFTAIQIAFLEQLAETLGISVNAIIANSRTDALLEESQRLTAELQARSSELQARSEELQESNADLEDKAALLAAQKQDIEAKNSEIERARAEIEERARQLALASQYKSQFLANMSHELRTPLNSLLILARLLAQNPGRNLTVKQVEYANVIHSAGSDLLQLINDILDLSKVEAGHMDVRAERFRLAALLEDIQATFRPLTAEKGLDFEVRVEGSAPDEAGHRPAAAAPGARQPGVQRGQVHRAGPGDAAGQPATARAAMPERPGERAGGRRGRGVLRHRHRDRHRAGEPRGDLRRVPAGRRDAEPPVRRYGPWAVDRQRGQRAARRLYQCHERVGTAARLP